MQMAQQLSFVVLRKVNVIIIMYFLGICFNFSLVNTKILTNVITLLTNGMTNLQSLI